MGVNARTAGRLHKGTKGYKKFVLQLRYSSFTPILCLFFLLLLRPATRLLERVASLDKHDGYTHTYAHLYSRLKHAPDFKHVLRDLAALRFTLSCLLKPSWSVKECKMQDAG